jgi:hypothetical protein
MKPNQIAFSVLCLAASFSSAAAPCLHYEGKPVTLSGKVTLQTFYGPPNYGESPETDSRETQAIMLLAEPICVDAKPEYDYDAETDQSEVTLIPHHGEKLSAYTEKQVIVSGTLFHAYTGHHNTPVLIELNSIHVGRD